MAIQLDSAGDYLQIALGTSEFDYNSPYTVTFWAKYPVLNAYSTLFMITDASAQNLDMIHVNDANRLAGIDVKVLNNYESTADKGSTTIVDNVWTHFALVRSIASGTPGVAVFLDAVQMAAFDEALLTGRPAATLMNIGAWINGDDHVDNLALYNLKIWTTELSASEIAAEKDSVNAVKSTSLWGVYHMDSISDLSDATATHSSITLIGTPTNTTSPVLGSSTQNLNLSSSVTPAGTAAMEVPVKSFLDGSSTGVGVVTRLGMLVDSLKGSTAAVGTLANQQVITTTDRSFASSCSPVGALFKTTNKHFLAVAIPFRQVSNTKLDIIASSGSVTMQGGITNFDMLLDSIHSLVVPNSTLVPVRIPKPVEVVFASSLVAPNAQVSNQTGKQLSASCTPSSALASSIITTHPINLSGTVTPAGGAIAVSLLETAFENFFSWLRRRHNRS